MPTAIAHAATPRAPGMPGLWHFAAEYLLLLPAGAAVALVWANTWPESYFQTTFALEFLVNDILMVFFFGLIMKEIAEATAPGGVLHPWRRAAMPLVAAVGLTLVPLAVFALLVPAFDEPRLSQGWPSIFAVDLAMGYLAVRLIFDRGPAIPFFLLLAIFANALGILALGATADVDVALMKFVLLMSAAMAAVILLRKWRARGFGPYVLVPGGLSWAALYFGGFEPAFALVPVVPFLPHARRDRGFFVEATPGARDALSRFELWARHPAQAALFLFGLVNAGVPLSSLYWGSLSLPIALFASRPLGLLAGVGVARLAGLHLPHGVGWREQIVIGLAASMGFTMALFFATAALPAGPTLSGVKMGALVSIGGGLLAFAAAAALRSGRFTGESKEKS